jgi:hypothetical protein
LETNAFKQVEDIAVLELERPAPPDVVPHSFVLASSWAGRRYMVYGVPGSNSRGDWADGSFKGETLGGWVQMLSTDGTDLQIDHGFSGAGVWDEQLRGFGGIIVANKKRGDQLKSTSYMIPAIILKQAWRDLPVFDDTTSYSKNHQISESDRRYAETENIEPEFVESILKALNRCFDGRMFTKERTAEFLDTVAKDATILADIWTELLDYYRKGIDIDNVTGEFEQKLRSASYNQYGQFGELQVFYHYLKERFGTDNDNYATSSFVTSIAKIGSHRDDARRILDIGLNALSLKRWDGTSQASSLTTLEDTVMAMKQEAGHLRGLAKVYRATM